MINNFTKIAMAFLAILFFNNCNNSKGYKTTEKGLQYNMVADTEGRTVKMDDFLTLNMKYGAVKNDSILFNTFTNPQPLNFKFQPTLFNGAINEGLLMMSAGDSAHFKVKASSVYKDQLPAFLQADDELEYVIKMIKLSSAEEQQREAAAAAAGQMKKEESAIQDYLTKNNLKAEKTESGLYYIVNEPGEGGFPEPGQKVEVHYTGTLLDGSKFDSSKDRNQPFQFDLGQGRVIRGWDEGIPKFQKGGSGILVIPSPLGYGNRAQGPKIPANSTLIFEIELLDFK